MRDFLGRTPWVQRVVKLAVLLAHAGLGLTAMLAFSGCGLPLEGTCTTCGSANFNPGPTPQNNVVFCDIEKFGTGFDNTSRVCADNFNKTPIIPFTHAAIALNVVESSKFGLDQSTDAVGRCGSNGEVAVFRGAFPQGSPVCLNCGAQIPNVFADGNAVCIARCKDLTASDPSQPSSSTVTDFCNKYAHVSTNVPVGGCPMGFDNACADGGTLLSTFFTTSDPRLFPEPVSWVQQSNVITGGPANNDLAASHPPGPYQAQATSGSLQTVENGDAYIEFSAGPDPPAGPTSKIIGFHDNCGKLCFDGDPSPADITFAAQFADDGNLYMLHNGAIVDGGQANMSLTPYVPGERFRITVTDQNNGTFKVKYTQVLSCPPGKPCNEALPTPKADTGLIGTYPITVDTSLRDDGAKLTDVRLVFIHPK